jgi:hypothetical protein
LKAASIILAHGGEVNLSMQDFAQVIQKAPQIPITHWRAMKTQFKKIIGY